MSHVSGDVDDDSVSQADAPSTESSTCQRGCGNSPPSGSSGHLPNSQEASCTSRLTTRAASNHRQGKRNVQEVTTRNVSPSLLPETSDGNDNRKKLIRLTHGEKLKVLQLHGKHLQIPEIARRFRCSERTIYRLIREKDTLQEKANASGYNEDKKTFHSSRFPEVEVGVLELIEDARKSKLPVTQATIVDFAMKTRDRLLSCGDTPQDVKLRMSSFAASAKWIRNFVIRHGVLKRARLDAEAERVDDVADTPSSDRTQQTAGDEMGDGAESQESAEQNEGEKTVDGNGSSSSTTREEMLHHLGIVEGFVAGRKDRDSLAYLHKIRNLYSTDR